MGDNIETDSLGKWAALSDRNDITILHIEGRRAVGGNILVSFFVTTVLGNVVQVIPSNDDSSLHLGGHDLSDQNSTTDGNITSEGAFLIDETSFDGSIRCLNSKTDTLDETHRLGTGITYSTLTCNEDRILFLVSLFVLCY